MPSFWPEFCKDVMLPWVLSTLFTLRSPLSCPDLFLYTITLPEVSCDAPPTLSYATLELASRVLLSSKKPANCGNSARPGVFLTSSRRSVYPAVWDTQAPSFVHTIDMVYIYGTHLHLHTLTHPPGSFWVFASLLLSALRAPLKRGNFHFLYL